MSAENAHVQMLLDSLLPRDRSLKILEAGCGSTVHLRLPENRCLVGIDISPRQLEGHTTLNERILGDIQVHNWSSNEFDLIVCWDVLEHLPDPAAAMTRMFAAVREEGLVLLALPNRYSLKGWVTRLTPFQVHVWFYRYIIGDTRARNELDQFPTHLHSDSAPSRVRDLAERTGLSTEYFNLYEGPVQAYLRRRSHIANFALGALGLLFGLVSLGRYNPNHSDCIMLLRKPPRKSQ